MIDSQNKFLHVLSDMFQFDQSDLDFGIYRIMSMKRDEISTFIEEELPAQIDADLHELTTFDITTMVSDINRQIADVREGSLSPTMKSAVIAELEEKRESLSGIDLIAAQRDVYSHLTNFFGRYYDDGDFISQRRYKNGAYAIPYEGEEVKLHWANADQYYVKTSEYFKDYTFKNEYGDVIHFKLMEADIERDNNKANEKRLFQLHAKNPFEIIDGELFIHVEYKASNLTGRGAQAKHIEEIVDAFASVQGQSEFLAFSRILELKEGKSLLERQLIQYTARNTFDYFIHKDLATFLNRELDFYIKNDVIYLDDIDEQDEVRTKEYLVKAKVIRKIGRKIITFLSQIEDFQKKLYLKKKFVVETNYCITLDRVPQTMYEEIATNEEQREEWVRLFAIDEIAGNDMFASSYSEPLTEEFLKSNPFLVLDTAFFSEEFKERLVASIDDLDETLDGLMIHSENSQALNLLMEKYHQSIKCTYIDPPYNSPSSEILYKNNYKDSSWITMMEGRLSIGRRLSTSDGSMVIAIDKYEQNWLFDLCKQLFPNYDVVTISIEHNKKGTQGDHFSYSNEFAIFVIPYALKNLNEIPRPKSKWEYSNFRNWGSESERTDAANCFYPLYVQNNEVIGYGLVLEDEIHPSSPNELMSGDVAVYSPISIEPKIINADGREKVIAVYPIDDAGVERKWRYAFQSIGEIYDYLIVEQQKGGNTQIKMPKYSDQFKTMWYSPLYNAGDYGTKTITAMGFSKDDFEYPKSIHTVIDCVYAVSDEKSIVLDYFAGSGTTAQAVMELNRRDGGKRKYILVEMGEYFSTTTRPRILKAIYSYDSDGVAGWKSGKPLSRKGSSHAFKYLRLESYEDTLDNIVLNHGHTDLLGDAQQGYFLSYMLNAEATASASLLDVERLDKPFDYWMNITRNLESKRQRVDLVETFNYLIGLTVKKSHSRVFFDADFKTGEYGAVSAELKAGGTYTFKAVEGSVPNGDRTLVLWREMTGDTEKDNAVLDAYFLSFPQARSFKRIYVNCDNNLLNLRNNGEGWSVALIDDEMKKRMFEDTE